MTSNAPVEDVSPSAATPPRTPEAATLREGISIWLNVSAPERPERMEYRVGTLAEPDFTLVSCRESAQLGENPVAGYSAHWYCRFLPAAGDAFAAFELLERLARAGFDILRYDLAWLDLPASNVGRPVAG